jgi:hypothetical protein
VTKKHEDESPASVQESLQSAKHARSETITDWHPMMAWLAQALAGNLALFNRLVRSGSKLNAEWYGTLTELVDEMKKTIEEAKGK